jgi:hypothetical protein
MPHSPDETLAEIRRTLARWQTTHPEATFAEMEEAVEDQLHRLRASLLDEQAGETIVREQPACQQCGERMTPRATARRHLVLGGDATVGLDRSYSVCPGCEAGLFPPG